MTTDTRAFALTIHGNYFRNEIPKGCRKPREVSYETTAQAEVPVATNPQAPVAFRVNNPLNGMQEVRTHNGKLYAPYLPISRQKTPTVAGSSAFPNELGNTPYSDWATSRSIESDEAFAAEAQAYAAHYLIIDGEVWARADEPRYVVMTYGMGANHGGTGISATSTDNENVRASAYFRADEYDAAIKYAHRISVGRGDTIAAASFVENREMHRSIEVLIPEAVTLVTVPAEPAEVEDMRSDYTSAARRVAHAMKNEEEAQAFERLTELRGAILGLGCPVVTPTMRPYEAR